jgi:hypothetical protein
MLDRTNAPSVTDAPVAIGVPPLPPSFQLSVQFDSKTNCLQPVLPNGQMWQTTIDLSNPGGLTFDVVTILKNGKCWFIVSRIEGKGDRNEDGIKCSVKICPDGKQLELTLSNRNITGHTIKVGVQVQIGPVPSDLLPVYALVDPQVVLPPG